MAARFHWTEQQERAFALDWRGLRAHQIAAEVGTTVRTVEGWRRRVAWRQRRERLQEASWRASQAEARQRWARE